MVAPRFFSLIFLVFFMIDQGFADQDVCEGQRFCLSSFATKEKMIIKERYQFKVGTSNRCNCVFRNIHLRWDNFDPLIPLDALTIRKDGESYLIKDGDTLTKDQFFIFEYIGPQPPDDGEGFSIESGTIV